MTKIIHKSQISTLHSSSSLLPYPASVSIYLYPHSTPSTHFSKLNPNYKTTPSWKWWWQFLLLLLLLFHHHHLLLPWISTSIAAAPPLTSPHLLALNALPTSSSVPPPAPPEDTPLLPLSQQLKMNLNSTSVVMFKGLLFLQTNSFSAERSDL